MVKLFLAKEFENFVPSLYVRPEKFGLLGADAERLYTRLDGVKLSCSETNRVGLSLPKELEYEPWLNELLKELLISWLREWEVERLYTRVDGIYSSSSSRGVEANRTRALLLAGFESSTAVIKLCSTSFSSLLIDSFKSESWLDFSAAIFS